MSRIPHAHVRMIDQPGNVSGSAASGGGRDLEVDGGKVLTQGGWIGGEGGL